MIIDINLSDKLIIIIGGGKEALKKIKVLLSENCEILVLSEKIIPPIKKLVQQKKIQYKKIIIDNSKILSKYKPFIIITTTDDSKLNEKILNYAKRKKILAFSSDNPEKSDFSHLAVIKFKNLVEVAISTKGKSPIIAKQIKNEIKPILRKVINQNKLNEIKIQQHARRLAKNAISTQIQRKKFLYSVKSDPIIKQLIKDYDLKTVQGRIKKILEDWK